ncbi:MAG: GNAT family N-acetyltransferase [Candidatus Thorarchaeota archaeon]|nr:GNAT family N-acetyltransferase [Candidatus Thorarchaeota archaeon]MCK5238262.1 GNAT family N-acetyltransferase [Candidatus Thorarchaeota archaeon]
MVTFELFNFENHKEDFIQLNIEYISWIADQVQERYGIDFVDTMGITIEEYIQSKYDSFTSIPSDDGALLILEDTGKVIGMGALQRFNENVGEIKRMYIKPEYRGKGFGKKLLQKLVALGKDCEYSSLRLDTGGFMDTAQHVYTSVGFKKIPEYTESEVPIPLRHHWWFMELKL